MPGRLVHGLQHVVDHAVERVVDALDRLGDEAQLGIGQRDDVAEGHGQTFREDASDAIKREQGAVKRVLNLFAL